MSDYHFVVRKGGTFSSMKMDRMSFDALFIILLDVGERVLMVSREGRQL